MGWEGYDKHSGPQPRWDQQRRVDEEGTDLPATGDLADGVVWSTAPERVPEKPPRRRGRTFVGAPLMLGLLCLLLPAAIVSAVAAGHPVALVVGVSLTVLVAGFVGVCVSEAQGDPWRRARHARPKADTKEGTR